MSGVFTPGPALFDKREVSDRLMEITGASTLADLRKISSDELVDAQNMLAELAVARGATDLMAMFELPAPEPDALARAGANGKPILHGTTADEYHLFIGLAEGVTGQQLASALFDNLGLTPESVGELIKLLRDQRPDRTDDDLHVDALTAARMDYPHQVLQQRYGSGADMYRYHFTMTSDAMPGLGAFHGLDVPYWFGTLDTASAQQYVGDNALQTLSADMMDAVVSFARDGRPAIDDMGEWPPYTDEARAVMRFGPTTELVMNPLPWMDAFSASLEASLGQAPDT